MVRVGLRAVTQDPVLDPEGGEIAGAHAHEGPRERWLGLRFDDEAGTGAASSASICAGS